MWGNIVINNAKVTSSFKHDPSLISSNVKSTWSLGWKSLMVNPPPDFLPHQVIPNTFQIQIIWIYWFLGYTTPKIIDKTNGTVYWSLTITTIHVLCESWIHHIVIGHIDSPIITDIPTIQIHFMFTPHVCGLLGMLIMLYSQCCGMAAWRLNYSYWC